MHSLEELPPNYTYIQTSSDDDLFYTVRVKEITDKPSALKWIEEYSNHTSTTWRVGRTYPQTGRRNAFKVDMRCVRSTDRRARGIGRSKNTGCPAKIQLAVLRFVQRSQAKKIDPLRKDWPTVVTLRANHNHPVSDSESLKYRDVSKQTRTKLNMLYKIGHSPASALYCLRVDLLLEHAADFEKVAQDAYYFPTYSVASKIFKKNFRPEHSYLSDKLMIEKLEKQLQQYSNGSIGKAKLFRTKDGRHCFVVICSPVMARTHENIPQAGDLVIVDTCSSKDSTRYQTYVFLTLVDAGCLPLGIIVSNSKDQRVFEEAMRELKNILPKNSFYGKNVPSVFLADISLQESLKNVFPRARCFSHHHHFMHEIWSFLVNYKQKLHLCDRQELYRRIRSVLLAETETEAQLNHKLLVSSGTCVRHPDILQYYLNIRKNKVQWTKSLIEFAVHQISVNLVMSVFRLMQTHVLNRVMNFNFLQYINFIITHYETYMQKILNDFVCGRYQESITKNLLSLKEDSFQLIAKVPDSRGLYDVVNSASGNHFVDILNGICSCCESMSGKLCIHISAVILYLTDDIKRCFSKASIVSREVMLYVSSGGGQVNDLEFEVIDMSFGEDTDNKQNQTNVEVLDSHVLQKLSPEVPATKTFDTDDFHESECKRSQISPVRGMPAKISSQTSPIILKILPKRTEEDSNSSRKVNSYLPARKDVLNDSTNPKKKMHLSYVSSEDSLEKPSDHKVPDNFEKSCSCCPCRSTCAYESVKMHDYTPVIPIAASLF